MGIWDPGPGATAGEEAFAADVIEESADDPVGQDFLSGGGRIEEVGDAALTGGGGDHVRGGGGADDIHAGDGGDAVLVASASGVEPISSGSGFA